MPRYLPRYTAVICSRPWPISWLMVSRASRSIAFCCWRELLGRRTAAGRALPSRSVLGSAPGRTNGDARGRRECRPARTRSGSAAGSRGRWRSPVRPDSCPWPAPWPRRASCRCSAVRMGIRDLPSALVPGILEHQRVAAIGPRRDDLDRSLTAQAEGGLQAQRHLGAGGADAASCSMPSSLALEMLVT